MMLHEEAQEILLGNISCYPNEFYLLYSKSIMFEVSIFFFFCILHEALWSIVKHTTHFGVNFSPPKI